MRFPIYLLVIDFLCNSIVVWEHAWYDSHSFKLLRYCFMAQIESIMVNFHMSLRKISILLLNEVSINVNVMELIDGSIHLNNFPGDFLSACSVSFWERGIEDSSDNSGLVCFSDFYQFHFMYFDTLLLGAHM